MENINTNEIVNGGINNFDVNEGSGIGTGGAVAIGVGLLFVIGAGIALGKKVYTAIKNNNNQKNQDENGTADPDDFEDVESN